MGAPSWYNYFESSGLKKQLEDRQKMSDIIKQASRDQQQIFWFVAPGIREYDFAAVDMTPATLAHCSIKW